MRSKVGLLIAFALLPALIVTGSPLQIDEAGTLVEADVRATGHTFTARVSDPRPEVAGYQIQNARLVFRWDAVRTGNATRDAEMLQWAEAVLHPVVTFTLVSIDHGADGGAVAHGTLAMHGRVKTLSFPIGIRDAGGGGRVISGSVAIDHRDWGLPRIRKMLFLAVDPVVTVKFSVPVRSP